MVFPKYGIYKDIVADKTGAPFPQDPHEQLRLAVQAVFDSWFVKKAIEYRRINGIPSDWGTAVTVMAMVFGNLGETSGTGMTWFGLCECPSTKVSPGDGRRVEQIRLAATPCAAASICISAERMIPDSARPMMRGRSTRAPPSIACPSMTFRQARHSSRSPA